MIQSVFAYGVRVRYLATNIGEGTIIRRKGARGNTDGKTWLVKWDNDPRGPRLLEAHESNMEILPR